MAGTEILDDEPPTSIDPYATLDLPKTATAEEVRRSYRKLALKLHPDKAAAEDQEKAHKAFQDLAFAYAILSDERRRKRYDTTGSTLESLDIEDDDFNWSDFFRTQYSQLVTAEKIDELRKAYKGSEEERSDLLAAYTNARGNMDKIFEQVILSNPLEDEARFREIIEAALSNNEIQAMREYKLETEKSKQRRMNRARREAEEAEKAKEELNTKKARKKAGKEADLADLALMIQNKNKQKSDNFLDGLLDKYGGGAKRGGKGSRIAPSDEPSEEAFAEMGRRRKRRMAEEEDEGKEEDEAAVKKQRTRGGKKAKAG
jgi:DnaJ homolog subfamily C member 9